MSINSPVDNYRNNFLVGSYRHPQFQGYFKYCKINSMSNGKGRHIAWIINIENNFTEAITSYITYCKYYPFLCNTVTHV